MGVKYVNGQAIYTVDKGTNLDHEAKIDISKIQNSEKRTKALTKEYSKARKKYKKKKKKEAKQKASKESAIKNKTGITGGVAQKAMDYRKEHPYKSKPTAAKKARAHAKAIPNQKLTSNEQLLLQTLSRTGTPNVVNEGLKSAEKTLRTPKAKTNEYKNLNKRVAKQDEKFLNSSPFAYGFMAGTSPIPLKETLELQTGQKIDTSKAEKSVGYKAGYMTGLAAEYATTGGIARDAVQQSIKTALKQAGKKAGKEAVKDVAKDASKQIAKNSTKLTKIGKRVLPGMAADTITGIPTNALEAGKEASKAPKGEKGKEFAKSLAVNTAFDVGMGAAGEVIPAAIKSAKAAKASRSSYIPANTVPKESKKVYKEYTKANNKQIADYAKKVENKNQGKQKFVEVTRVNKPNSDKINELTGVDTTGYTIKLRGQTLEQHITPRHGANGKADKSMADINDLSRMGYIIDNADRIDYVYDKNGRPKVSREYTNKDSSRANLIMFEKKIDGHYYVVTAVPDTKDKSLQVVSSYIKKAGQTGNEKNLSQYVRNASETTTFSDSVAPFATDVKPLDERLSVVREAREEVPKASENISYENMTQPEIIKKAEQRKVQQVAMDKSALEKDLGADINRVKDTTEENIKEYGQFVKDGKRTNVPQATAYGDTTQGAVNIRNSKEFEEAKDAIDKGINEGLFAKHTETQKTALSRADETIAKDGLDVAAGKVAGYTESTAKVKKEVSQDQIMLGYKVAQKYLDEGNIEKAVDVLSDTAMLESEAGRALQAARIFSSLTPAGKVKSVTKVADKLSKEKNVDITLNKELLEKLAKTTDADEAARIQNDIAVDMWNQVPPTIMDKINAWRYTSMLSSPKTHIRNMLGNAMFVPFRIISNGLQVGMEKAFVKEANRTRAILNPATDKNLIKMGAEDYKKVEFTLRNNTKYIDTRRPQDARVYKLKPLESARKFVSWSLDAEDGLFMKYHYSRAYARYLKAQKIKGKVPAEVAEKARAFASQEALEGTYRDANALSDFLNNTRKSWANADNKVLAKLSTMMLDTTVPFVKTPANILKQGVRYSPLGLAEGLVRTGIYGVKKSFRSPEQVSKIIKEISEGLTGTGVTALGAYLAYEGLLNTSMDTQSKKGQYDKMLGEQEYSVNIGDYTYTVDWTIPASMPMMIGAEIAKFTQEKGLSFVDTLNAISNIAEPLLNLSMLSGIENTFNTAFSQESTFKEIAKNTAEGYVSQFFPTLLSQIAKTTTETRKSTTATNKSLAERDMKRYLNQLTNKIPFANENLADYINLWGGKETKRSNSDYFVALLQNVFSPGTLKKKETTSVDRELLSLYDRLDDDTANTIIPKNTPSGYGVAFAGTEYQMSEKDLQKYKETRGRQSYEEVHKLINTSKYRNMSDEDKAKAIKEIYSDAGTYAKEEFLRSKGVSDTDIQFNKLRKETKAKFNNMPSNVTKEAYVAVMSSKGKAKADTDGNRRIRQVEAEAYLDTLPYSNSVKAELWQAYNAGWAARNNPYR
jgi:hypothetical protein